MKTINNRDLKPGHIVAFNDGKSHTVKSVAFGDGMISSRNLSTARVLEVGFRNNVVLRVHPGGKVTICNRYERILRAYRRMFRNRQAPAETMVIGS